VIVCARQVRRVRWVCGVPQGLGECLSGRGRVGDMCACELRPPQAVLALVHRQVRAEGIIPA
jgi:hypothetical protein